MQKYFRMSRRQFLSSSSIATSVLSSNVLLPSSTGELPIERIRDTSDFPSDDLIKVENQLDLSPARWIWYPAQRILPNSFFHFRKTFNVDKKLKRASGWIVGESRYTLFCNGTRVQFGPAPSDPRYTEADPIDLTSLLASGNNTVGATVLYYGFGDGTWPAGKAGFIFKLELEYEDQSNSIIVSDESWQCQVAKSWKPGMYKRWYLRALQESFDNRFYPQGWSSNDFLTDHSWRNATLTGGSSSGTALGTNVSDYLFDSGSPSVSQLCKRSIPLMQEEKVFVERLRERHYLEWKLPPEEYFDLVTSDAFNVAKTEVQESISGDWTVFKISKEHGLVLSFSLAEQVVGWPFFSIDAPEATTIELMVEQGHTTYDAGGPALMNTNLNSWTRFICKAGVNEFMTFDYESVKWIQLHIHHVEGSVKLRNVGVLRRTFDFAHAPILVTSDQKLQKLFNASFNTMLNNCHETIVDCMGRERQQYSGDIGHVIHMAHRAFGEVRLPKRYVQTFSQGITADGFFMDSWPAYDRLNRLGQRQLGLTPWGPLLDHSVGFNFDVWYHYLYTGELDDLQEVFPRLLRFYNYLKATLGKKDLFDVENLGIPAVWMDSDSYQQQRHKQCAYNLYVAGMLKDAFANLCRAFGQSAVAQEALAISEKLTTNVRKRFWNNSEGLLINNLPWYKENGKVRTCERSLAHYVLNGTATENEKLTIAREMTALPERFGVCYPPNAQWRYWTLAACGKMQHVIDELRSKWFSLSSVSENNTLPETWNPKPNTHSQYSHAPLAPIYAAYMSIAGISVLEPGYKRVRIEPAPGDIDNFNVVNYSVKGEISLSWSGLKGVRQLSVTVPKGVIAELALDKRETTHLPQIGVQGSKNLYLIQGTGFTANLEFT